YHWTMKSIDSKLSELDAAEALKETVASLAALDQDDTDNMRNWIRKGREDLAAYERQLADTLSRRRDRNGGKDEPQSIDALQERFADLETALANQPKFASGGTSTEGTGLEAEYRKTVLGVTKQLANTAGDLRSEINTEMRTSIASSRKPYRLSMWIVLT